MKIHEYQAKEMFKNYNIPIQDGYIVERKEDIERTIDKVMEDFSTSQVVIKAQIHAGGRGKGGGVKFCSDKETAIGKANDILGMNLVTPQTGKEGRLVKKIMICEAIDIKEEYYVAITLDRVSGKNIFMISKSGGMEIEEVAAKEPEKIVKEWIEPTVGLRPFQAQALAYALDLKGNSLKQAVHIFLQLYQAYTDMDGSLLEINPLVLDNQDNLLALDGKVNFDDNALYRIKNSNELRDLNEEDESEIEASKYHLNFIKLDGNVGCMVNGAGLAMATMDIIKLCGGEPANFLDVGGSANSETVKNAFRIILSDQSVKAVLINIFGGIVRCDRVANGIVEAVKELGLNVPVVVRLAGTNAKEASKILNESGLSLLSANSLKEAAEKVVSLV